jgi:glutaredoxin
VSETGRRPDAADLDRRRASRRFAPDPNLTRSTFIASSLIGSFAVSGARRIQEVTTLLPSFRLTPDQSCFYNKRMHDVVVYSRKGCHLCDVVKDTLAQLQGAADFQWRELDIDADATIRERYNDEIPVVFIDGRKAFKYHMDKDRFLRAVSGLS